MKNSKLYIIILSIILSNVCFAQSGWYWQNPLPQGNNILDVKYISNNIIYAVGSAGLFAKSIDNGLNWSFKYRVGSFGTYNNMTFSSLFFLNQNTGFVTTTNESNQNFILKTINAGEDWEKVTNVVYPRFYAVFFANEDTGWASCCADYYNFDNKILKTTNKGLNWYVQTNNLMKIKTIFFLNAQTGWAAGDYINSYPGTGNGCYIYKTTDGGDNFSLQIYYLNTNQEIKSIFFIDENQGWAGGTKIWKSTNSGGSWVSQNYGVNMVNFFDQQTGFITNISGNWKTENGGENWFLVNTNGGNSITSILQDNLFVVGNNGLLNRSVDRGINWEFLSQSFTNQMNRDIKFVNENTGFLNNSSVYKTTNKGLSWSLNYSMNGSVITDFCFLNDNTGWLIQQNGSIHKTINSGNNWIENNILGYPLQQVYFINNNSGWISGEGFLYKTTNGGNNWEYINQPNFPSSYELIFLNENIGLSVFNEIFRTDNGGLNWSSVVYYGHTDLAIDQFNNCYAIGINRFLKSTDMGQNWSIVLTPITGNSTLKMINQYTGYIGGSAGIYQKTTDGGISWEIRNLPTSYQVRAIDGFDTNNIWMSGDNGFILSTVGSGMLTSTINNIKQKSPINFSLSQNYPNPFNPKTKINFDVTSNVKREMSNVKLIIYDLLGREVATLINEELKPGTYEADWDGSNYSSGVYFYKIIIDDPSTGSGRGFVETKKMVLMK